MALTATALLSIGLRGSTVVPRHCQQQRVGTGGNGHGVRARYASLRLFGPVPLGMARAGRRIWESVSQTLDRVCHHSE
jgi:hypothetical protein